MGPWMLCGYGGARWSRKRDADETSRIKCINAAMIGGSSEGVKDILIYKQNQEISAFRKPAPLLAVSRRKFVTLTRERGRNQGIYEDTALP